MRQLTPLTNLMLACLCAVGLVGSLELPWYAPVDPGSGPSSQAIRDGQGPMESFVDQFGRTFRSDQTGVSGHDLLAGNRTVVMTLALMVIALCLGMAVPVFRSTVRDVLRAVGLVAPILVLLLAVRAPAAEGLEFRWGLVVSVAIALFMASAAWHGSSARTPRAVAAPRARPAA
jgi:hypothetical protein